MYCIQCFMNKGTVLFKIFFITRRDCKIPALPIYTTFQEQLSPTTAPFVYVCIISHFPNYALHISRDLSC